MLIQAAMGNDQSRGSSSNPNIKYTKLKDDNSYPNIKYTQLKETDKLQTSKSACSSGKKDVSSKEQLLKNYLDRKSEKQSYKNNAFK